jgi:hypothetical protein
MMLSLKAIARFLKRTLILWVSVFALCLTGCVQSDVEVRYIDQHHGEIVQHIQLGRQLTSFSGTVTSDWLKQLNQRAKQLGGRTRHLADEELEITIPFSNSKELEAKFNQLFRASTPETPDVDGNTPLDLPEIRSHLTLTESNLLLVLRDRLSYDLDLRSLSVLSSDGTLLVSPGSLLDLKFSLVTPWGAYTSSQDTLIQDSTSDKNRLVWTLKAGEINHLKATFWLPSPLGMGTLVIVGFVALGMLLKALLSPIPEDISTPKNETLLNKT